MFRTLLLIFFLLPLSVAATVQVNEIAWMGTSVSATDEWIELWNDGSEAVNLEGWKLEAADGSPKILLGGTIAGGGYFLLERSDDDSVPGITADLLYTGALGNSGEYLKLTDTAGGLVHEIDQTGAWVAGDNTTKETMQWNGTSWITAIPTPRAPNVGVTGESGEEEETSEPQQQETVVENPVISPTSSYSVSPAKTISGKIKKETKTVVVGADTLFLGEAYDFEGESIPNARFLWNFGDGTTKEGKHISHVFRYPGTYVVVLDIASGAYSASDRIVVEAIAIALNISQTQESGELFIKVKNNSSYELELSGWLLKQGSLFVRIPEHSFLLPKKEMVFPGSLMGFSPILPVVLLYPNGKEVVTQAPAAEKQKVEAPAVAPARMASSPPAPKATEEITPVLQRKDDVSVEGYTATAKNAIRDRGMWSGATISLLLLLVGGSIIGFFVTRRKRNFADEFTIINDVEREK